MKVAIALMTSLVLVMSVAVMIDNQRAFADQASATVTYHNVGGAASNRSCVGITEDNQNNIWMACNSNSATTGEMRLYLINSTGSILHDVQISSSLSGGNTRIVYEGTLVGGFETVLVYTPGSAVSSGVQHTLRMYYYNTTAGAIQLNSSFTVSSCNDVGFVNLNKVGDNYYFACDQSSDQIRIIANQLFQFNSYSGMKTGSPTCTNLNGIHMYSSLRGVAVCDNTTLIQFSLSGSTITKGDSITVTESMAQAKMLFANNKVWSMTGGDLYAIPFNTSTNLFTEGDNSDVLALDAGISDMLIGGSGFIHAVDQTTNAYFMFNTAVSDATAALVFTSLSGFDVGVAAKMSQMTDNVSFVFTKGTSSDSNYNYFSVTDVITGTVEGIGDVVSNASDCQPGTTPVVFSTGIHCVAPNSDGLLDISGINPLYGGDNALGVSGLPVALATLLNVDEESAKIMSAAGAVLFLMSFIMIPAWKFGHSPPFFVWFIVIMFGVAISTVLGWIEPLYFAVMVVIAALGAGLKWSGAL